MFKIGEFSRLSNVSVRMLRHYEKMELLIPETVDKFTSFRYYSARQLETVGKIQRLKHLGFSLAIIRRLLEVEDIDELSAFLDLRQQELEEELRQITTQHDMLDSVRKIIREDSNLMNYNVVYKTIPARKVMSIRRVMPSYQDEGILWGEMFGQAQQMNVRLTNPPMGVSVFHDAEYKEENVDVEIQSSVEGNYADMDTVRFYEAPAVNVASVTFRGAYDQMNKVTQAIGAWIEDNGYQMNGPMMNIMHVSPGQDPNPENWVTEACFPVEKIGND